MAFDPLPPGEIAPPNSPTPATPGDVGAPNTPTPGTPGELDAPNDLSPRSTESPAAPNALASETPGELDIPNALVVQPAIPVAIPNDPTALATNDPAAPNALAAETPGDVAIPNVLTAESEVAPSIPNSLSPESAIPVSIPVPLDSTIGTNLLIRSQELDNAAWTSSNVLVADNAAVAPDGTLTAENVVSTSTASDNKIRQNISVAQTANGKLTISFHAKKQASAFVVIGFLASPTESNGAFAWFNMNGATASTSSIGTGVSVSTSSVAKLDNAWFRFQATFQMDSSIAGVVQFLLADSDGSLASSAGEDALMWGAQAEEFKQAHSYVPTTTAPVSLGVDAPNDLLPATDNQTNLILWSEQVEQSPWITFDADMDIDFGVSPNGSFTADKITANTTGPAHIFQTFSITLGATVTFSIFVKKITCPFVVVALFNAPSTNDGFWTFFDLEGGIGGSNKFGTGIDIVQSQQIDFGNGWFRCSITVTTTVSTGLSIESFLANGDGDGTNIIGNDVLYWGAMAEESATLNDYVKTTTLQQSAGVAPPNTLDPETPLTLDAPNVLMAGGSSNFALWSEELDNAVYTKIASTILVDDIANPLNGLIDADKIEETTDNAGHQARQAVTGQVGDFPRTYSAFVRPDERSIFYINLGEESPDGTVWFDTSTVMVGTQESGITNAGIEDAGGGWFRIFATATVFNASTFAVGVSTTDNIIAYAGTVGFGGHVWGVQSSDTPTLTSYLKTQATIVESVSVQPPNLPVSETPGDVAIPNLPTSETPGDVAIPNLPAASTPGDVAIPNLPTSETPGDVAIPNVLAAETPGDVAIPNLPTPETPIPIPVSVSPTPLQLESLLRVLAPLFKLDFAEEIYLEGGVTRELLDFATYSRNSSASFINRRRTGLGTGPWEYFLDTDFVGSVQNLLAHSEDYVTTDWVKSNVTIIGDVFTAPDGTRSADKMFPTSSGSDRNIIQSGSFLSVGLEFTSTFHVKSAGLSWVSITNPDLGTPSSVWFNVLAGTIGTSQGGMVPHMTDLGDGWFRCSVTGIGTAASGLSQIVVVDSDLVDTVTSNGTDGIYIWGSQVSQHARPAPYVRVIEPGPPRVFIETPRITYDAVTGEPLGVQIEGSSTNNALHSEDFSDAVWTNVNSSVIINDILALDDSRGADKLSEDFVNGNHAIFQSVTAASGNATMSVFVRTGVGARGVRLQANGDAAFATFDLVSGAVIDESGNKESTITLLSNGWARVSMMWDASGGSDDMSIYMADGTSISYVGDTDNYIYVWGFQVEDISVASSYIRTNGSTDSRAGDNLTIPVAGNMPSEISDYTQSVNFLLAGTKTSFEDVEPRVIFSSDAVSGDIRLTLETSPAIVPDTYQQFYGSVDGLYSTAAPGGTFSASFKKSTNLLRTYIDGVFSAQVDVGAPANADVNGAIYFGQSDTNRGAFVFLKAVEVYNVALTDEEIEALG